MRSKLHHSQAKVTEELLRRIAAEKTKLSNAWIKMQMELGRCRARNRKHAFALEKLGSSPEKAHLRKDLEGAIDRCNQALDNLRGQIGGINNLMEELALFEAQAEEGDLKVLAERVDKLEKDIDKLYPLIREIQSDDD